MGEKNSSITRVWPVILELLQTVGSSTAVRFITELAFKTSGNTLASELRAAASSIRQDLIERPLRPRSINGLDVRLPECFEYVIPPSERFLLWLLEHTGQSCVPREGLSKEQRSAGRRNDLFGTTEILRTEARAEAVRNLLVKGVNDSRHQWWALEGPTVVDCFFENDDLLLIIEGKRTEPISPGTDWYAARHQIARNLEAAQSVARGRKYGVVLIAEQKLEVTEGQIIIGLPHMAPTEAKFLAGHFIGCVTWIDLCTAARLPIDLSQLDDIRSAQEWLTRRGYS